MRRLSSFLSLISLLLVGTVSSLEAARISRGPYLQQMSENSVIIVWRTDMPTNSEVRYGTEPETLDQTVSHGDWVAQHEVRLTGLQASTKYFYSIASATQTLASGAEYFFVTAPPVGTRQLTRIWILGDSGTADKNARAVRDAMINEIQASGRGIDLWLMLGDNAYPHGTDAQYQSALFDMYPSFLRNRPLWPTLGNHDGHSASSPLQSGPYYNIFVLPRRAEAGGLPSGTEAYYSFDYANIHFIALDSEDTDTSVGGPMLTWAMEDANATDQDWIIAYWHHPPYSKGRHDSDSEGRSRNMRERALPVLEAAGVDLVLSGHSHSYERSVLVHGAYDTPTTGDGHIVDGGEGNVHGTGAYLKDVNGTVYVVGGSSGKAATMMGLPHPLMSASLEALGSVVLDIDGNRMDSFFLDDTGAKHDHFTMIKLNTPSPPSLRKDEGPVANAGPDQELQDVDGDGVEEVQLDGSGSYDRDGTIVGFVWREGTVQKATGASPSIPLSVGQHTLILIVTDNDGLSSRATLTVNVQPRSPSPPKDGVLRVPQDYGTIQAAIDAAVDGNVVLVSPGEYRENLMLAKKSITLASEFYVTRETSFIDRTVIDGCGGTVVTVASSVGPETTIEGFTIRNGTDGISAWGTLSILNNYFTGNKDAIDYEAGGGICRGNTFVNNGDDAIDLDGSTAVIIEDNVIRDSGDDGIEVRLQKYSGPMLETVIRNNLITGSWEDGIQFIDYPDISDRMFLVERNVIADSRMAGIGVMDNGDTKEDFRAADMPERVYLFNNTLMNNRYGVTGGDSFVVLNNLFVGSAEVALKKVDGDSIASHNLFYGNAVNHQGSHVDLQTCVYGDPLLDADYHLAMDSPAIDAGTARLVWKGETVLDMTKGAFSGNAPDLGSKESRFSAPRSSGDPPTSTIRQPLSVVAIEGQAVEVRSQASGD